MSAAAPTAARTAARTGAHYSPARLALLAGSTIAVMLVSGCTGTQGLHSAGAPPADRELARADAKSDAKADKAVVRAEQAVAAAPRDAGLRVALGQSYLAAGRFSSASATLDDAMSLGDNTGKTALALALALIGEGRHREAIALLDDWRGEIPAGDMGLALALAGDTSRGVAVLADAVRSGESSPKLRQNLAYAYALDGRWAEARLMAAQDVPAGELDQRLALWALSTLPDRNQNRVAGLIGAPVRLDPGQPAALALAHEPVSEQLAVQTPQAPALAAAELPAVAAAQPSTLAANLAVQARAAQAPAVNVHRSVAQAFGTMAPTPAQVGRVHFVPQRAPEPAPERAPERAADQAMVVRPVRTVHAARTVATGGAHLVQLGAFSSHQGARRAWGIFTKATPALASYRMTITPANFKGKPIWRVAAGGVGGRLAATGLCSSLKARGGACFAYAAPMRAVPAPSAPGFVPAGPQRARR